MLKHVGPKVNIYNNSNRPVESPTFGFRSGESSPSWNLSSPTTKDLAKADFTAFSDCQTIEETHLPITVWIYNKLAPTDCSTITSSTASMLDEHLDITMNNDSIPTSNNPKTLSTDKMLTFNIHAKNVKSKLQARNNVLKILAWSTWGEM